VVLALPLAAQREALFVGHPLPTVPEGVELDGAPVFAPDGTQVAYAGKRDGALVPIVGEEIGESFDFIDPPVFGASGEQVAFRVGKRANKKSEDWWIWRDGKKTESNDWIGALSWSPDGSKLAYWTQPGAKLESDGSYKRGGMVLVVDGRKGAKWNDADALTPPVWSEDSKVVATSAMKGGEWCVLLGDKPSTKAPFIDSVSLSRDGKSFAVAAKRVSMAQFDPGAVAPTEMHWEVILGKRTFGVNFESAASPTISPDGRRVAYKVTTANKCGIAIDDEEPKLPWDFVTRPVWSDDSRRLAYAGVQGGELDRAWIVSKEGDLVIKAGSWRLVVDGEPTGENFDELRDIVFSPSGKLAAFRARTGAKWQIVCGTTKSESFDFAGPPSFDTDSRRLAFGIRNGREFAWKVLELE
jgi:Tol biopolymer transport system component